jgi:hypothetical protein
MFTEYTAEEIRVYGVYDDGDTVYTHFVYAVYARSGRRLGDARQESARMQTEYFVESCTRMNPRCDSGDVIGVI